MTIKRTGKETDKTIRSRFELLREICEDARKVQILIYGNPDPDALASALSMKKILQAKKRSVKIGYTGAIGRPENACMLRTLKIPGFSSKAHPSFLKKMKRGKIMNIIFKGQPLRHSQQECMSREPGTKCYHNAPISFFYAFM